jgi:hypothetical protein
MSKSFNSTHKNYIRTNWGKPLLRFLTKRINDKLVYLGLPSSDASDVMEWIEFIKIVIAFQCRDYPKVSNSKQKRTIVEELDNLLNVLERESKIEGYVLYDGYLEEIVLRGYDNSPKRIQFDLGNFITLYNLDFCNKISSPLKFINQHGEVETAYKINAINKLLQVQNSLSKLSNKFVLFLTVHCSYDGEELDNFLNNPPNEEIKNYISKCKSVSGHDKNARIVRAFVAYYIQQQFSVNGFTPKILPVIVYNGLKDTLLLHFTVFGVATKKTASGVPSYQSLTQILNSNFISINDSEFINKNDDFSGEVEVDLDPVKSFSNSKTFKKLWI